MQLPRGLEVLIKKAAVDRDFCALLLARRAGAAQEIGLELTPAETAMLSLIPREQLAQTIERTEVPEHSRRAFLGKAAAAMLAALGMGGLATGCSSSLAKGIRPDMIYREDDYPPCPPLGCTGKREIEPIYFDHDQFTIRPDQLDILNRNLTCFMVHPFTVVIEGHCDERGSTEYNMALGQKRAEAVKRYLIDHGLPAERIVTISFGKEQPADPRQCEEAWAKNRRAHFKIR